MVIPSGGRSLIGAEVVGDWRLVRGGMPDAASLAAVAVSGEVFDRAHRVSVANPSEKPWGIEIMADLVAPIREGDVCLLAFWMRCVSSSDEAGEGHALAFVQQNFAPHRKVISQRIAAGKEWRQYCVPFRAAFGLEVGKSNMGFHLGYHIQTVEIAEVALLNYGAEARLSGLPGGTVTYEGRSPDAAWRGRARKRIEKHRKADLSVIVRDHAGEPIRDARVEISMQRHAFGFGAALVSRRIMDPSEDGRRYREIVAKYYTKVVLENDLKWGPWKVSRTNAHRGYRKEWTDGALRWLADRGIQVRGHWLSWGSVSSGGQEKYVGKPDEHRADLFAHIREKVEAVGTRVCEWDAINHPVGWGVTYEEMHGGLGFHADIFRLCREVAPADVELWINEGQILPGGGRRDEYERIVRYLIDQDQAPDGIGFMGHFGRASLTPIPELHKVFDRYADIIPRLQITEFDVKVGDDEELQADYLRDVMTLAFSHPAMQAIVMWGFWEGQHWKPEAALYRKDWSIKPAGEAWLDLVRRQWWTEAEGGTDRHGSFETRGFLGDYLVNATYGGHTITREVTLGRGGVTLQIRLP